MTGTVDARKRPPVRHRPSRRVRRTRALWIAALLVLAALVAVVVLTRQATDAPLDSDGPATLPTAPVAAAPASLEDVISAILGDAGDYRVGIALSDVPGGAIRTFGDEDRFFAASTAKIITAAAFYQLVEQGDASLDDPLGDFDAAFQLEAMVNNSSNDAWLLLMDAVGYPQLTAYAASLGIDYDPEENLLTAADMALVLRDLSAGDLLDEADTAELLGYMQDTNDEALIPAASRPDIMVQHKYGQVEDDLHDAALLTYQGTTVALVIYTEAVGDGDEAEQTELIHEITRAVEDSLFRLGG
jgi:beta-lactamase class A